jgi:hypothetical protein
MSSHAVCPDPSRRVASICLLKVISGTISNVTSGVVRCILFGVELKQVHCLVNPNQAILPRHRYAIGSGEIAEIYKLARNPLRGL